jgi:hypothetical protein
VASIHKKVRQGGSVSYPEQEGNGPVSDPSNVPDDELLRRVRVLIAEHQGGGGCPACPADSEGLVCCVESLTRDWSDDPYRRAESRNWFYR